MLLAPFAFLPPVAGLLALSVFFSIGVLLIVKATSRPSRIAAAKRQMSAALLEIRLFNDDPRAVLRGAGELFTHNLEYLRSLAVPLLVSSIPLGLLLAHLDSFYSRSGLVPGRSALVTAHVNNFDLATTGAGGSNASLEAPPEVRQDTTAVWFPATREIVWRVTPLSPGEFRVVVHVADQRVSKVMHVSDIVARRAVSRVADGALSDLFDPPDQWLPSSGNIQSVAIRYPPRQIWLIGWRLHWLALLITASFVFAVVLKQSLGVAL